MPLTHLSQSSLQDYVDCPRRFKLRYVDRLSYPAEESEPALEHERHLWQGDYFHRLAQQSLLGLPKQALTRLAVSADLTRWWENWETFRTQTELGNGESALTEITLSAPIGPLRLVAKYDLIVAKPGEKFTIYDWKTYRRRTSNDELARRMQTRVYRAMLVEAGAQLNGGRPISPDQIEMIYWFADFPSEPAHFPYSASAWQRDWAALQALAAEITSAEVFELTDDPARCTFCSYRSYCDRGVRAGRDADLETEHDLPEITLEQVREIEF
jgi:predicted RecB family nuclease